MKGVFWVLLVFGLLGWLLHRPAQLTVLDPATRAQIDSERVVVFSADWCGPCKALKSDLQRAGIPYSERDIDRDGEARRAWRSLGGRGIPVTLVGNEVVHGYAPDLILRLSQQLP